MDKIRFLTAGESHGRALTAIIEGLPAGLEISEQDILTDLKRRQRGYGRGGRMQIERDYAKILSGVRYGKTLGSPICLLIENKDWPNWVEKMSVEPVINPVQKLQMPRPGHADYAGMVKYQHDDLRNILERSSARETAARVAAGAVARKLLSEFGIRIFGHVTQIGPVQSSFSAIVQLQNLMNTGALDEIERLLERIEKSETACADEMADEKMKKLIDETKQRGDTLGGQFEIVAIGLPIGLGSFTHWDRRLDGRISWAMGAINAMKCVEIGLGSGVAQRPGSQVHDELFYEKSRGYYRKTNNAGGIEGGMSNGEPIVVRVSMKPLPTLSRPLMSVDCSDRSLKEAFSERSDVCAVPAAVVVAEAVLALVLAEELCRKLGGDSIKEMHRNYKGLVVEPLGW
ncbi:chorismate synthase [candidate division KSB1 bacterium]|nr:chorismate synthase [candidate division KSB1 bacterium]